MFFPVWLQYQAGIDLWFGQVGSPYIELSTGYELTGRNPIGSLNNNSVRYHQSLGVPFTVSQVDTPPEI